MVWLKKNAISITMFIVLVSALFLSIYAVYNYKSSTGSTQNRIEQRGFFGGQRNQPQKGTAQRPDYPFQNPGRSYDRGTPGGFMQGRSSVGSISFSPYLTAYSILFFVLSAAAYYFIAHKNRNLHIENEKILIFALLCVGLLLRIAAATLMDGHPYDINIFKNWASAAVSNLTRFYSGKGSSDYPPLYIYVLFLVGKIAGISGAGTYYPLLLKFPSMCADIVTSLIIYKLARKHLSLKMGLLLSAFYIFNPAVFINSTFWGQVDSFFTMLIVSSVYMLCENKICISSALFASAVLMKPQGIIFLPVLFFELVRRKSFKCFVKAAVSALSAAFIIVLPFSLSNGPLWIFKLFSSTIGEYKYASVNAFNFFSLIGKNYVNDSSGIFGLSFHLIGMAFIVLITLYAWFVFIKGNNSYFAPASALILIAGVFAFSTRMHERYLFPAAALSILAFIYLKDKRFLTISLGLSAAIYINTSVVMFDTMSGVNSVPYNAVLVLTSILSVLLFIYLVKVLFDITVRKKICMIE